MPILQTSSCQFSYTYLLVPNTPSLEHSEVAQQIQRAAAQQRRRPHSKYERGQREEDTRRAGPVEGLAIKV